MTLLSVAVGMPTEVRWNNEVVLTSIFKTPINGRVRVGRTNIAGDRQSDLTVHGGPDKAVYAYPSEHYAAWQRELGIKTLPWASFGENLTTRGLRESVVCIGDRYRIGTTGFIVRQPRMPCYKLEIKFGRSDMIRRFASVDRSGFYFAVEEEGEIGAGDDIELIEQDRHGLTVAETFRLMLGDGSRDRLQLAASHPALAVGWRENFRRRLGA
ncbi:MAG: MOSC domain-containing protein [Acidobacteriota bacterium]